ncbi:MAG: formate dehydrogenase accessory sulfurtransferase FdhD [Firmicutes bacterium]|jgi:FdhD protein|nr:formate dehydrogenase accessory sulfurtransferase FdhD [Bacillota bacterium]
MVDKGLDTQGIKEVEITRIREKQKSREKDFLVREVPLTIFLNGQEFVTLLCSPEKLNYLAVGFLRLEGLLKCSEDLQEIAVDTEAGKVFVRVKMPPDQPKKMYGPRAVTARLGKGTLFAQSLHLLQGRRVESALQVKAAELFALMAVLQKTSVLFKKTGGVHTAALAVADKILFYSEDIGRHNAIDKIVGECILKNIPFGDKILLSSGRVSSEIIIKVAKLGLPMIVSRSAPTSLSVELAAKMGITLVGFVRGRRLNVYTHENRIFL